MKKISMIFLTLVLVLGASECFAESQNLQVFSADNANGKIGAKTIQKAFNDIGVIVDVNNDMNSIFSKRFGKVHHKKYNLAIFTNEKLVKKLMSKYPSVGMITPLSMSIYSGKNNTINVSTLSLAGMARLTKIPVNNPDLKAYAKLVDEALHKALVNGKYLSIKHNPKAKVSATEFTMEVELEDGDTYADAIESFEEEFEGELGPVGYLIPKKYSFKHPDYDAFDTYSIIRFNAIFPVSKNHPEAGAYAPFSVVIYKKKDEKSMHIMYPSIDNWIADLDIEDANAVKEVHKTQSMIKNILTELTE